MPYFDYDGDIRIDPDDYIDNCSKDEIKKLIQYLVDEEYLPPTNYVGTLPQSISEVEFGDILNKIHSHRLQLTNEEDELLRKIASRF